MNSDYEFFKKLDSFKVVSGSIPFLITAPHAFSDGSLVEKQYHLCDFAVQPIINEMICLKPHYLYIIENMIPRSHIDMNRFEARKEDDLDENDYLFRQIIRFLCIYLYNTFKRIPIVIDLHSYPKDHSNWAKNDLMILIQTKHGMKTDEGLVDQFLDFFSERGYKIGQTAKHNQDDIVEELKLKNLAYPILLEINEDMPKSKMSELSGHLLDLAEILDNINIEISPEIFAHADSSNYNLQLPNTADQYSILKIIGDSGVKSALKTHFDLFKPKSITNATDSVADAQSIDQIIKEIPSKSRHGNDFDAIFHDALKSISGKVDSIILPVELIDLYTKSLYSHINRVSYTEWGLNPNAIIDTYIQSNIPNIYVPLFHFESPSLIKEGFPFQKYRTNEGYLYFLINCDPKLDIEENRLKKQLLFLQKIAHIPLFDSISQLKKRMEQTADNKKIFIVE